MTTHPETINSTGSTLLWRIIMPVVLIAGGLWFVFKPARVVENPAANLEAVPAIEEAKTTVVENSAATVTENVVNTLDPAPAVGHPAPEFALPALNGQVVSLSDFRGKPVIVNFWATWCGPCRLEMPHLQESYAAHQADDLVILGVNLTKDDDPEAIPAFIEEFGLTFPIILDEAGEMRKLYQLLGQPASVFIDREGIIQEYWQGPINQQFIEERLEKIL